MKKTVDLVGAGALLGIVLAALVLGCKSRPQSELANNGNRTTVSPFSQVSPPKVAELAQREWERLTLQASTKLFQINIQSLFNIGAGVSFKVEKASDGRFQRMDSWRLNGGIAAGSILLNGVGSQSPVYFNIDAGKSIEFIRVFDTKEKAFFAAPRTMFDVPLSVPRVMELAVGEYVSIPVTIGLGVGLSAQVAPTLLEAGAGGGLFWSGEMRMSLQRMSEKHFRLRFQPGNAQGFQLRASAGIDLDIFGYGPFGLVNLDRQVEKLLQLDFASFSQRWEVAAHRQVKDYLLDLSSVEVQHALAKVLLAPFRYKDMAQLPFADLAEIEEVARQDRRRAEPRVHIVTDAESQYSSHVGQSRVGTRIFKLGHEESSQLHQLTMNSETFAVPVFRSTQSTGALYSPLKSNQETLAIGTVGAERIWPFYFRFNRADRQFTSQEKSDFAAKLEAILGPDRAAQLAVRQDLERIAANRARGTLEIALSGQGFTALSELPREQLEEIAWQALSAIAKNFAGRIGPDSPGPAVSPGAAVLNVGRKGAAVLRESTESLLKLQWPGVQGTTGRQIVAILTAEIASPTRLFARWLALADKDRFAQEILPAFLLELFVIRAQPYWGNWTFASGENPPVSRPLGDLTEKLADSEQALGQIFATGYMQP